MLSHFIHPAWAASALKLCSSWRCCSAAAPLEALCACNKGLSHKRINQPETLNSGLKFSKLFTKLRHLNSKEITQNSWKPLLCQFKYAMNVNPTCAASALKFSISSWYCCAAAPAKAALCALHPTPPTNRTFCQADLKLKSCNFSMATSFLHESTAEACTADPSQAPRNPTGRSNRTWVTCSFAASVVAFNFSCFPGRWVKKKPIGLDFFLDLFLGLVMGFLNFIYLSWIYDISNMVVIVISVAFVVL